MTNRNKNELQTSQGFEITAAQILRGVWEGTVRPSEFKLSLTSADDSNAFLLSCQSVSVTTSNVGTEKEGACNDEE